MAEILGAASAVAGLMSLSGTILSEGYSFLGSVRRAPKELRQLLSEISALDTVLGQLEGLTIDDGDDDDSDEKASRPMQNPALTELNNTGVLKDCHNSLQSVRKLVASCEQVKGQQIRSFGKTVIWPFKAKETKDSVARLSRLRELLVTALAVDSSVMLRDIRHDTQQISAAVEQLQDRAATVDDLEERRLLFKWLEPNPASVEDNLNEALKQHHPGTGKWLLESDAYKRWSKGPIGLLWIHGIPGSGKTVLASSIIRNLLDLKKPGSEVIYFFCDHRDSAKQTTRNFLGQAAVQMLSQQPNFVAEARRVFQKSGSDSTNAATNDDLLHLLAMSISSSDSVTIVIDALDECKELEEFASILKNLLSMGATTVRMLVTSRPDYGLQKTLEPLANNEVSLDQNIQQDINYYIAGEVDARIVKRQIKVRSPELRAQIKGALCSRARGMFLWLDLISRLVTDKAIRKALKELPEGLDETYFRVLEQVKERNIHNLGTVCKLLSCIISCLVPLTLGQLAEIVSIEPDDRKRDLDKMATDPNDLLEMLGCLVVVDRNQEDPTVTLAHYTAHEFLTSDRLYKHETLSMFYVPTTGILDLGLFLAQYMSFAEFEQPRRTETELSDRITSYKLLDIAATELFNQMGSFGGRGPLTQRHLSVLHWFIEPNTNFLSWQQVFHRRVSGLQHMSPLFYATHFEMENLSYVLIRKGADPLALSMPGYDELAVTVISGHEQLVSYMLQANLTMDLEQPQARGSTYLHLAASNGSHQIVKLLLEAGASPDARSDSESTPLYRAARCGSIPTMELLLDAGSDVNAETWDGFVPIIEAIEHQHVEAIAWLVSKGANLKHNINGGGSVLDFAQGSGNEKVVQIIEDALQRC